MIMHITFIKKHLIENSIAFMMVYVAALMMTVHIYIYPLVQKYWPFCSLVEASCQV